MRILVLFAHPVETSFGAALHAKLVEVLRARGHKVDDCDLNAEGFDPVMSREDRIDYYNLAVNRRRVSPYVERLLAAEAIVFSFPVWNMGFPAILKGFVDKVFLPGVSFTLGEDGAYTPCLHNIKRLGVVCTVHDGRSAASLPDPVHTPDMRPWRAVRLSRPLRHGSTLGLSDARRSSKRSRRSSRPGEHLFNPPRRAPRRGRHPAGDRWRIAR